MKKIVRGQEPAKAAPLLPAGKTTPSAPAGGVGPRAELAKLAVLMPVSSSEAAYPAGF